MECSGLLFSPKEILVGAQRQGDNETRFNSREPCWHHLPSLAEERRIRRMASNRESAQRSRLRKQRHLEQLANQIQCLRSQNLELSRRVGAVAGHSLFFRRENERLLSEATELRRRLLNLRWVLVLRQLHTLSRPQLQACGFPTDVDHTILTYN